MTKSDRRRIIFLKICVFVCFGAIAARLFDVQILGYEEYLAKAAEAHVQENVIEATRGEIYMMDNGEPVKVVMNEIAYQIVLDPMVADEEKVVEVLNEYVKDNIVVDFADVFSDKTVRYYVVAKNVSYENAKKIEEAELSGVSFEKKNKRVYMENEMASGVLGFVNANGEGQYGVEGAFDEKLSGTDGSLKAVRDVNGIALSIGDENVETPAVDGEDVILTIDRNIQSEVEEILVNAVDSTGATNAAAVVMDPSNGKVLAMANVPTYDMADYGNVVDASVYTNYITEVAFEPASVCKTFTYAAGVDLGLINRETTYYNTTEMTVDETTFNNAYTGFNGATITYETAFAYSLNVGSANVLKLIGGGEFNQEGRQKLYDYFMNMGLGQYTGVELYEATGFVPTPNQYDYTMNFTYANMTFGQGMSLTMMQVITAYAAIINGGKYYSPTIVAGEFDENGEFVEATVAESTRKVISEEASAEMRGFLYRNRLSSRNKGVDKDGYYIGGKTGTGQVIQEDGTYSEASGETVATYVGFGGAEGELPEYIVMVKLWGEGQHLEGEKTAQPVFDEISNYLINYLKIKPNL